MIQTIMNFNFVFLYIKHDKTKISEDVLCFRVEELESAECSRAVLKVCATLGQNRPECWQVSNPRLRREQDFALSRLVGFCWGVTVQVVVLRNYYVLKTHSHYRNFSLMKRQAFQRHAWKNSFFSDCEGKVSVTMRVFWGNENSVSYEAMFES